jgi:LPXTG-motif cell wall-anchored protein
MILIAVHFVFVALKMDNILNIKWWMVFVPAWTIWIGFLLVLITSFIITRRKNKLLCIQNIMRSMMIYSLMICKI